MVSTPQSRLRRASLPTVVPTDSRPLSWPPIGALPRNRLAASATGGAAAISPYAGEPLRTGVRIATASVRTGLAMTYIFTRECNGNPVGSSGRPTPTHRLPIELRRGRRPRRPVAPRFRATARIAPTVLRSKKGGAMRRPFCFLQITPGCPWSRPWARRTRGRTCCRRWCRRRGRCARRTLPPRPSGAWRPPARRSWPWRR